MKASFTTAILAVTLSAAVQATASTWPAACGQDSIQFKVKTDKKQSVAAARPKLERRSSFFPRV
jgi:hypothetical protein